MYHHLFTLNPQVVQGLSPPRSQTVPLPEPKPSTQSSPLALSKAAGALTASLAAAALLGRQPLLRSVCSLGLSYVSIRAQDVDSCRPS